MQQRNEAWADSGNKRRDHMSKQVKTQVWIRTCVAKVTGTDSWSTHFRNKIHAKHHYGIRIFYLNSGELKIYLYILRMKEKSLQCDIAIVLRYIYSNTKSVFILTLLSIQIQTELFVYKDDKINWLFGPLNGAKLGLHSEGVTLMRFCRWKRFVKTQHGSRCWEKSCRD